MLRIQIRKIWALKEVFFICLSVMAWGFFCPWCCCWSAGSRVELNVYMSRIWMESVLPEQGTGKSQTPYVYSTLHDWSESLGNLGSNGFKSGRVNMNWDLLLLGQASPIGHGFACGQEGSAEKENYCWMDLDHFISVWIEVLLWLRSFLALSLKNSIFPYLYP